MTFGVLFFGDDDMWVYLDEDLVCDIGGTHLVAGEYVDLWDYFKDANGNKKVMVKHISRGFSIQKEELRGLLAGCSLRYLR